jgi:DNA invertase Pin-like site-specific DNA recombinase
MRKETKMEVVHLNQKQLAARWSISEATLERWRCEGIGPRFLKLCGRVLYRQVDIVVVYKIDRLTRSLTDISRMIEVFERHGVSFVSVTQQFNTTTSMGRLMLNILLSFAQFEREVTGERIRDKFAASKRKGMWMGGIPPLGYDVKNRRLVPNPREAKLVQHIFRRFAELGSSTKLVKELKLDGVTSKSWTTQDGRFREGKPMDKSLIYKLLRNRTYLGELKHRDSWVPGEHPAIIGPDLWDPVHAILSGLPRLPAAELESAVLDQLRAMLKSPEMIATMLPQAVALDPTLDEARITVALQQLDSIWAQLFPVEQQRVLQLLIEKVIVSPDHLEVRLRANGIERVVLEMPTTAGEEIDEEVAA